MTLPCVLFWKGLRAEKKTIFDVGAARPAALPFASEAELEVALPAVGIVCVGVAHHIIRPHLIYEGFQELYHPADDP